MNQKPISFKPMYEITAKLARGVGRVQIACTKREDAAVALVVALHAAGVQAKCRMIEPCERHRLDLYAESKLPSLPTYQVQSHESSRS